MCSEEERLAQGQSLSVYILYKVILLADSTLSGLLSLFDILKIKKFTKSQPPNVYPSQEISLLFMTIF
jgi:hypothetical protein